MGDHSETIQIDYDPAQISYTELLEVFWESHSPIRPSWSRQYRSAIFYHNEEQQRFAEESKNRQEATTQKELYTDIEPASTFYLAEDYHQKYRLRQYQEFMTEFAKMYPNAKNFVNSTAAARINGYLAGYGSYEMLLEEVKTFGLSESAQETLLKLVKSREN